jgi:anti-sigma regulatory factor (Ser/Thr protein kinase)
MGRGFAHQALIYAGDEEFLAGTLPFVRDGLDAGEPVLVALPEDKIAALRGELGPDSDLVHFEDMASLGRNPARIIPVWREFVAAAEAGRPLRGIGEPAWPGRSEAELAECDHHESLLNRAFADAPAFTLLCPYDKRGLADEVLEAARRNHPELIEAGRRRTSGEYVDPGTGPGPLAALLAPPAAQPAEFGFGAADLRLVRSFVCEHAVRAGLDSHRQADLVLAVSELAANSVQYGGGEGRVRVWRDGELLHCEVADDGRLDDPLVGRARPSPMQERGRGLWLVNQLCDLVQLRSGPDGTVGRVSMRVG